MNDISTMPSADMPRTAAGRAAVVLVTDVNYFLPTFAAAMSADAHIADREVTIELFVVDAGEDWIRGLGDATRGTRIRVRRAELAGLAELAQFHRDDYLPPIALARFWIGPLLEPGVDRFLYLDGDTMVDGELNSLLAVRPPEAGLMAVSDFLRVYIDELGLEKQKDVSYLNEIRCEPENYFNSGVIYASRRAWAEIVPVAARFLREHPETCRASDQTALNYASSGRVRLLPLRYNYQTDHMMVLDPRRSGAKITIWHFSGAPKPWDGGVCWPWDDHFNAYFRRAQARLAGCGVSAPVAPEQQMRAGLAHRRRSRVRLTWIYPWRKFNRRSKIRPMLATREGFAG